MMDYEARSIVWGKAFLNTVLAAFKVDPGAALIVTPKVRLSTDPAFNPLPTNIIADFTAAEADFSGYTAGGYALTLSGPVNVGTQMTALVGDIIAIMATASPLVTNSVYGYWIDDGTNVILAERFADGVVAQFGSVGDYLTLQLVLPQPFFVLAA